MHSRNSRAELVWKMISSGKEVTQAPAMFRLNGIGCALLGRFREPVIAPRFISVYCFTFAFLPIFPIALYVVSCSGDNWRVYRFHREISFKSFFSVYGWGSLRLVSGVFLRGLSLLF